MSFLSWCDFVCSMLWIKMEWGTLRCAVHYPLMFALNALTKLNKLLIDLIFFLLPGLHKLPLCLDFSYIKAHIVFSQCLKCKHNVKAKFKLNSCTIFPYTTVLNYDIPFKRTVDLFLQGANFWFECQFVVDLKWVWVYTFCGVHSFTVSITTTLCVNLFLSNEPKNGNFYNGTGNKIKRKRKV